MDRVSKIEKKYGKRAFVKWGMEGGNKMLKDRTLVKAYKEGRVRIVK